MLPPDGEGPDGSESHAEADWGGSKRDQQCSTHQRMSAIDAAPILPQGGWLL